MSPYPIPKGFPYHSVSLLSFPFITYSVLEEIMQRWRGTRTMITESQSSWEWKEALVVSLFNPLLKQGHPSQLLRIISRWVLNISKDGDTTASLGSLFLCLVTLRVKKCFQMFWSSLLCFCLCLLPCILSLAPLKRAWPCFKGSQNQV